MQILISVKVNYSLRQGHPFLCWNCVTCWFYIVSNFDFMYTVYIIYVDTKKKKSANSDTGTFNAASQNGAQIGVCFMEIRTTRGYIGPSCMPIA